MDEARQLRIPQADDISRIMDLPLAVEDGNDTAKSLAKRYGFDERQSNYYLEAAEILGLVSKRKAKYVLTEDGKKYLRMDITERKHSIVRRIVSLPIVSLLLGDILVSEKKTISKEEIERIIKESSRMGGSTIARRAHTLMAWLRWVGDETGGFDSDANSVKILLTKRSVQRRCQQSYTL